MSRPLAGAGPEPRPPGRRRARAAVAWGAALAALSFAIHLGIGWRLADLGVLHQWNVLFDADPNVYAVSFASGHPYGDWGGRSFIHPNLSLFVHPPLALAAKTLERLGLSSDDRRAFRRRMTLFVSPAVAAARAPILLATVLALGLPLGTAVVLCLLEMATFSSLLFGSIPESYGLSGTLMAAVLGLAAAAGRPGGRIRAAPWIGAGILVTGVTVTNLVPFAAVFMITALIGGRDRESGRRPGRAVAATAAMAGAVALATVALYQAGQILYGPGPPFTPFATPHLLEGWRPDAIKAIRDFPLAVADAFAPGLAGIVPGAPYHNDPGFVLAFRPPGVTGPGADPWPFLVHAALALGLIGHALGPPPHRLVAWACVAVLSFNGAFHAFYGTDLFLYSQHWQVAAVLALAGVHRLPPRPRRAATVGTAALALYLAAKNAHEFRRIFDLIASPAP